MKNLLIFFATALAVSISVPVNAEEHDECPEDLVSAQLIDENEIDPCVELAETPTPTPAPIMTVDTPLSPAPGGGVAPTASPPADFGQTGSVSVLPLALFSLLIGGTLLADRRLPDRPDY